MITRDEAADSCREIALLIDRGTEPLDVVAAMIQEIVDDLFDLAIRQQHATITELRAKNERLHQLLIYAGVEAAMEDTTNDT